MKDYISSKIVKLTKYAKEIDSASVILTVEKKRQSAVVVIWADGISLTSKEATGDIYASIDSVLTKMESQFRKHRKKLNSEFQRYFKRLQKEFNADVKQRKRFKTNRDKLYATIVAGETYLNDFGLEFLGIV